MSAGRSHYLPLALVTLALTACGANHGADRVVTQTVLTPVPVSCVPADLPARPTPAPTGAALKAAQDMAARYQMLQIYWTLTAPFDAIEDGVLDACRKAGR